MKRRFNLTGGFRAALARVVLEHEVSQDSRVQINLSTRRIAEAFESLGDVEKKLLGMAMMSMRREGSIDTNDYLGCARVVKACCGALIQENPEGVSIPGIHVFSETLEREIPILEGMSSVGKILAFSSIAFPTETEEFRRWLAVRRLQDAFGVKPGSDLS